MDNTTLLLEIKHKLEQIELMLPSEISLSDLAQQCKKEANTIRKFLIANYEPDIDFWKKGDRIYMGREVALCIRRRYAK